MEQDSKRLEAMNQQHSETEEEVKARIEKEAEEKFPSTFSFFNEKDLRKGYRIAALPRELEIARLRAELTALREKTAEIAGNAWDQSAQEVEDYFENDYDENGPVPQFSVPAEVKQEYLEALRSELNSSSNKG